MRSVSGSTARFVLRVGGGGVLIVFAVVGVEYEMALRRTLERGQVAWESMTALSHNTEYPHGLHAKQEKAVFDFLRDPSAQQPLLVYGPHHVGKSTLIGRAAQEYLKCPANDAGRVPGPVLHLALKNDFPASVRTAIEDFYCAAVYKAYPMAWWHRIPIVRVLAPRVSPRKFTRLGDSVFAVNELPHVGDAAARTVGVGGLIAASARRLVNAISPEQQHGVMRDVDLLHKALELFDAVQPQPASKVGGSAPAVAHSPVNALFDTVQWLWRDWLGVATSPKQLPPVVWITDVQNLINARLDVKLQGAKEEHAVKTAQTAELIHAIANRHKHGYSTRPCSFKLLMEESDYLAAIALIHYDDEYYRSVLVKGNDKLTPEALTLLKHTKYLQDAPGVVDALSDNLRSHTGDWFSVQQFLKHRQEAGGEVTVDAVRVYLERKQRGMFARMLHDIRVLPSDPTEPPCFLETHLRADTARLLLQRREDPLEVAALEHLNQLLQSAEVKMPVWDFFRDAGAHALVRAGACIYDPETEQLMLQRPASKFVLSEVVQSQQPVDKPRCWWLPRFPH
jgi:hypothetical protein